MNKHGVFICCPECIDTAYDDNGRLGFLKDEWIGKMVSQDGKITH